MREPPEMQRTLLVHSIEKWDRLGWLSFLRAIYLYRLINEFGKICEKGNGCMMVGILLP